MELRPYQTAAIDALRAQWRQSPLYVAPTGSGKTVVMAEVLRGAVAKGKRGMIVAHTRQIVLQTAKRFAACGLDVSCIMAGQARRESAVYVASIQTLIARKKFPAVDIVLIDEAHHCVAHSYSKLVEHYRKVGTFVSGCTATPLRLDGRGLGEAGFGALVASVTPAELVAQGFLMEPIVYAGPREADRRKLKIQAGEFTAASAGEAMKELDGDIVKHWQQYGQECKGVVFASTVEHGSRLVERLAEGGARVKLAHGGNDQYERDETLDELASGALDLVVNCQLYGEGWDLPALDLLIQARPTASLTVHLQQVGRVVRPIDGKRTPIVLDHAGNHLRHGFFDDPREWSLDSVPPKDKGVAPCKTCPKCFAICYAAVRECPECGHVFIDDNEKVENALKLERLSREQPEQVYAGFVRDAWSKGHKIGRAQHRYQERFGAWPRNVKHVEREHYPCEQHTPETHTTQRGFRLYRCAYCYRTLDPATHHAGGR